MNEKQATRETQPIRSKSDLPQKAKAYTLTMLLAAGTLLNFVLPVRPALAQDSFAELSPGAQEVARDLNIDEELKQLFAIRAQRQARLGTSSDTTKASKLSPDDPEAIKIILLRQEINETITAAFLELRVLIAHLDKESTSYTALRNYLEDKRDRAIRLNSITNFIATGTMSMVANGFQIPPGETPETVGAIIGTLGGALSTGISTWALKLSGGVKVGAQGQANMLSKLFDIEADQEHDYPHEVWRFVTDKSPDDESGLSRKDALIKRWIELKRIKGIKSDADKKRLQLLCDAVVQEKSVDIDLLEDRSAMLADVKAMVSLMFEELLELIRAIHGRSS